MDELPVRDYIASFSESMLAPWVTVEPWILVSQSDRYVRTLLGRLGAGYRIDGEIAIHSSATVECGAIVKGPAVIGPNCFVAAGAYIRGGCWLDAHCILGPGAELKSSFLFEGSKLAHFNFVGDSVVGCDVNLEAGSIVANYRNEREDKQILVRTVTGLHKTGVTKFGALLGDHCRIGSNAVVAPGALLLPGSIVKRMSLLDQEAASKLG